MARPGLHNHRKFKRLLHELGEPRPHVRGYLELLWDVGYEAGNPLLGDALAVEAAAEYPGLPGKLTQALQQAGFIDQLADGSFQIHDLLENAPDYVRKRKRMHDYRQKRRHGGATVAPLSGTRAELFPISQHPTPNTHKKPKKASSAAPADGAAASQPEAVAKKGTPNPLWDALCEVFGLKPVTEAERKRVGRIVRDLKAKDARPEEIAQRLARYRQEWPKAAATPEALLKHWDTFGQATPAGEESPAQRDARIVAQRQQAEQERQAAATGLSFSELSKEAGDANQ